MIEAESLVKRFGRTVALDGVSFRVNSGEIVGLLGPNGAGKTTVMRILTGYLAPTSGTARVAGNDVQEKPLEVRKRIGYMPETVPVYGELTVRDYLRFTGELHDIPAGETATRIEACMEQSGVSGVSNRLIGHLSRGFRQRVGIAQALLHNPELLILDEPTVGLDPTQVVEIRQLIRQLAQTRTVILSSHILPEVSQICSRVIIIDRGRIVAEGTQEALERTLKGAERLFVELRTAGPGIAEALGRMSGVRTVTPETGRDGAFTIESDLGHDIRDELFALAARNNWPIIELRPVSMSLEEVFSRLTRQEEAAETVPADAGPGGVPR